MTKKSRCSIKIKMTNTLHLESPAKINLRLEILKKREDGYHELRTILQKISLYDTLHFSLEKEKGISIMSDHPALPIGKRNLVHQAVQSILKRSCYKGGVCIKIGKRIPLGAGLGGGSSNAATTLKALNQLLNMDLSMKELMGIGAEIGADVPFFFFKGAAIGLGIGERLKKIELPALWYVLIYPNFEVSTRWAYQSFVLTRSTAPRLRRTLSRTPRPLEARTNIRSGSTLSKPQHLWGVEGLTKKPFHLKLQTVPRTPKGISRILQNDLEEVVSKKYPQIGVMKQIICSVGALGASMTGSGPTVFGIFQGEGDALQAYKRLKKMVRGKGWIVLKAHSIA
jgi:4-diphosphocytidyl-2-C-methyl-D-erythritol kinase